MDVPSPFNIIPKSILQKIGTAAVRVSLSNLQNSFVDNLASDYTKWSDDKEYRSYRATFSEKEAGIAMEGLKPSESINS